MLAGKTQMERQNQVAGIVHRTNWNKFGLETMQVNVGDIPKGGENNPFRALEDFQIGLNKQLMVSLLDIVVLDKFTLIFP